MNGMCRVESDNSVDADEPIMKHLMEGGVTILKQLERKKQVRINYKTFLNRKLGILLYLHKDRLLVAELLYVFNHIGEFSIGQ